MEIIIFIVYHGDTCTRFQCALNIFNVFNGELTITIQMSELQEAINMTRTEKLSLSHLPSPPSPLKSDWVS
jgi:hypothetical protein